MCKQIEITYFLTVLVSISNNKFSCHQPYIVNGESVSTNKLFLQLLSSLEWCWVLHFGAKCLINMEGKDFWIGKKILIKRFLWSNFLIVSGFVFHILLFRHILTLSEPIYLKNFMLPLIPCHKLGWFFRPISATNQNPYAVCRVGWALWNRNRLEFKFDDTRLSS